jgi:membrane-associated protease RseP (regulator of RpoE activity)
VARRHGVDQGLPLFLPFPLAFGTLGAIIRLRSLPPTRSALIEIGAAGPIAGFCVAILVMLLGLPGTVDAVAPVVELRWPLPPLAPPEAGPWGWLADLAGAPEPHEGLSLMIMANPPLMDLLGVLVLGAPPGRYAELGPLALAGWAGCFLTAMNLLPVGQLDGGHVTNGLAPGLARSLSRAALALVIALGLLGWKGWVVWSVLLLGMGATRSLPIRAAPGPSTRAAVVAALAGLTFALCWMSEPIEMETVPWTALQVRTPDGRAVPSEEVQAWAAGGGGAP